MEMADLRRLPKGGLLAWGLQYLAQAVGESSIMRIVRESTFLPKYAAHYSLGSSRVDYDVARGLYRNTVDKYKLGAGFAKPIINTTAGFMGVPIFNHPYDQLQLEMRQDFNRWTGKQLRLNRNTLRDGDWYVRLMRVPSRFDAKEQLFDMMLLPPEWVQAVADPILGGYQEVSITYPMHIRRRADAQPINYSVTETITPARRKVEADSRCPADLREQHNEDGPNPWGFIPVVHFKNEGEENELYGMSDLEPVEPFLKAYHDTMLSAAQGSKLFSRPKVSFSVKDVSTFISDNFTAEEIRDGKLKFASKEIFFMREGEKAEFITADSGLDGITTLLKFLFMCIVDVSETPEFAFGTAVQSSKASVSEQLLPLAKKIERKRGLFEEPFMELGTMYAAMWAKAQNLRLAALGTYQASIEWDELSPRNDKEVAETIKALVDGLSIAVESRFMSHEAASEFLKEFIPSMNPWELQEGEEGTSEVERMAKGLALARRLDDPEGWEEETGPDGKPARGKKEE
jgi:hypothetical protein